MRPFFIFHSAFKIRFETYWLRGPKIDLILRRRKVKATEWNRQIILHTQSQNSNIFVQNQRRRENKPQELNNQHIVSLEFVIPFRNLVFFFSYFTKIQSSSYLLCTKFLSKCFCFASYSEL